MPLLNEAPELFVGTEQAHEVFFGVTKVWPGLVPIPPPESPSNVTCVATTVEGQLQLTWSAPVGGGPVDEYVVQYLDDTTWVELSRHATPTTVTYTWPFSSAFGSRSMRVRSESVDGVSGWVSKTVTPGWRPGLCRSVSAVPTAVVGQLRMTWLAPNTGGEATSQLAEANSEGSTWVTAGTSSPASYTFTGSSGTRNMRVRASNSFGDGEWTQVSNLPLWVTQPAASPTISVWKPNAVYGRMRVTFKTASSANYQYRIMWNVNNGAWQTYRNWTACSNNQTITADVVTGTEGNSYRVRVDVRSTTLTERLGTNTPYYTLEPAIINFFANSTSHYRQGTWNYQGDFRAYQGYFSNPAFQYYGYIFYDRNGLQNAVNAKSTFGGKKTVTGIQATIMRRPGIGVYWVNAWMGVHNGDLPVGGAHPINHVANYGGVDNQGNVVAPWLVAGARDALVNNQATGLGFSYVGTADYAAFANLTDNVFSGMLTIHSLG